MNALTQVKKVQLLVQLYLQQTNRTLYEAQRNLINLHYSLESQLGTLESLGRSIERENQKIRSHKETDEYTVERLIERKNILIKLLRRKRAMKESNATRINQ